MANDLVTITPDPALTPILVGLLRHGLTAAGTLGVAVPTLTDVQVNSLASFILGFSCLLASLVWTVWNKIKVAREKHAIAKASAAAGAPVAPVPGATPVSPRVQDIVSGTKLVIAALLLGTALSACTATQTQKAGQVASTGCDAYRVLSWGIPLVKQRFAGKLDPNGQAILAKAEGALNLACSPETEAVAQGVTALLYPPQP